MFKTPAMRLSIALVLLTVNLLFLANLIGLVPDESESALELRKNLSESLALQFSAASEKGELQTILVDLESLVSFVEPNILKLGKARVMKYIQDESRLKIYRLMMESVFRMKKHILTASKPGD